MGTLAIEAITGEVTLEERRELLQRVAGSVQLKRAARLREFLLYAGGQSLKDGCGEIHEQEIGTEVFGRSLSYDTSQDNIVRVNASELRKRIQLYFASEGINEDLLLEIPRGSYKPVFRRRVPEILLEDARPAKVASMHPENGPGSVADAEPAVLLTAARNRRLPGFPAVWTAAGFAVLAISCVVLFQQNRTMRRSLFAWSGEPALSAFWPGFLHSHENTDIILADTSVALIADITGRPISLSDYLNHRYVGEIESSTLGADRKDDVKLIASRHNGSMGDFRVAQEILALDRVSSSIHLQYARDYMPDSIKRNNVILIGSSKSNPWVHLFDDHLNFTIEYDPALYQSFIVNHSPQSGEQATYAAPADPYASVGYGLVAYLPNPSHTGSAIILAGTTSEATNAAGEFLTSEKSLEGLRSTLKVKDFPYFEVLLKTTHLSGTPFSAEIVAFRSYPDRH